MKWMAWMWLAALLPASVYAGNVYVCKGKHGETVFQGVPCAKDTKPLKHLTYDNAMGRTNAPEPSYEKPVASGTRVNAYQSAAPELRSGSGNTSSTEASAYACQAGRKRWVQSTPCPATYSRPQVIDVDGYTNTGTPVTGTAVIQAQAPVQSQSLSSDQICAQLNHFASTGHGDAAEQGYERNKMRAKYNCGGP